MSEMDISLYAIVALLPLSAGMVVLQVNPYHALVIRGILGAIAALVYALLGAADVALTEALVGTMLAITLYAVAVRSSLLMRLGILTAEETSPLRERAIREQAPVLETESVDDYPVNASRSESELSAMHAPGNRPSGIVLAQDLSGDSESAAVAVDQPWQQVLVDLRRALDKRHLRLEVVTYPDIETLQQALREKEVHAICTPAAGVTSGENRSSDAPPLYQAQVRIRRLYDILQAELTAPWLHLSYAPVTDGEK
nr:DUF4040 domain-containing protein [Trichothermofontia sichuanensis]